MKVPAFIARAIEAQGKVTVEEVERRMEIEAKRDEQDERWRAEHLGRASGKTGDRAADSPGDAR